MKGVSDYENVVTGPKIKHIHSILVAVKIRFGDLWLALFDGGGFYRKINLSIACLENQALSPLDYSLLVQLVSFIKRKTRLKFDLCNACGGFMCFWVINSLQSVFSVDFLGYYLKSFWFLFEWANNIMGFLALNRKTVYKKWREGMISKEREAFVQLQKMDVCLTVVVV